MTFELLGRVHKELSITGHAFYETVLAISELVNRKVQIIRLHRQASTLLKKIDEVTGTLGQQIVTHVSDRLLDKSSLDSGVGTINETLTEAIAQVRQLKTFLVRVDTQIRELKLEAIHQDLLAFQRDLTLRSGGIERITVTRGAAAAHEPLSALPYSASAHVATVFRGPFVLAPTKDLLLRPGDIVILIGAQAELDKLTTWFTGQRALTPSLTRPA
ncbi:MAG: TrkA C-terminal domain-containing protein [Nitrospira sp.]|nr:TrkA C-terminal domain-containing protein [Nitrospira sp.]